MPERPAGNSDGWEKKPERAPQHPYWLQAEFDRVPQPNQSLAFQFLSHVSNLHAERHGQLSEADVLAEFHTFRQQAKHQKGYGSDADAFSLYHAWLEAQFEADAFQHLGMSADELSPAAVALTAERDQLAGLIEGAMDLAGMRPGLPQPLG